MIFCFLVFNRLEQCETFFFFLRPSHTTSSSEFLVLFIFDSSPQPSPVPDG